MTIFPFRRAPRGFPPEDPGPLDLPELQAMDLRDLADLPFPRPEPAKSPLASRTARA